mgnify:CR=1 FL=1
MSLYEDRQGFSSEKEARGLYVEEIVLDSFAGSGAVGEAALNTKRSCILIERKYRENKAEV